MSKRKQSVILGSNTAKGGFRTEEDIVEKFNNWEEDKEAREWLEIMGYKLQEIEKVKAVKITGSYKTDVQVQITIYLKEAIAAENLSIKLVSNPRGYNQIDKRWIDKYVELWNIPEDVIAALKSFTGEKIDTSEFPILRDKRRSFLNEMDENTQRRIVEFFSKNKLLIVSDILKGRGKFSAGWMLVVLQLENETKWVLKSINEAMNIFGSGKVEITIRGSLKIGKITMQRKGGDAGRETAKMLQFKINPVELFNS